MEHLDEVLGLLRDWVWGPPLLVLLLGTGFYLTWILRGFQFFHLGYAFKQIYAEQKKSSKGDINPYEALMTTLAGAIGTGAIVGVSTGLVTGGLGSLFWMWLTALLGMATKYAESLLAIKYRVIDKRGEMVGGPMEYIEHGLKKRWLAVVFAVFGCLAAIGTGNLVQVNSIAESVGTVLSVDPWICGIVIAVITAAVVLGGIRSIGHVAGVLVPFMAVLYVGFGLYLIALNFEQIPHVFAEVFRQAFNFSSLAGGIMGSAFMIAMQHGVSRSVFSNEAGLGISSIAAAAAKTDLPGRQAVINMTGALISTVIVCTITAFAVSTTGVLGMRGDDGNLITGAKLAIAAFETGINGGAWIVTIGLTLFAFTTVLAWGYYGEKCSEYLFGEKSVVPFRLLYCLIVIPGAAIKLELAWFIADIANGLMAIPNLVALVLLSPVIVLETKEFIKVIKRETEEENASWKSR
jgi:AGCS family alanine or glycine:cation symporter